MSRESHDKVSYTFNELSKTSHNEYVIYDPEFPNSVLHRKYDIHILYPVDIVRVTSELRPGFLGIKTWRRSKKYCCQGAVIWVYSIRGCESTDKHYIHRCKFSNDRDFLNTLQQKIGHIKNKYQAIINGKEQNSAIVKNMLSYQKSFVNKSFSNVNNNNFNNIDVL